jgi:hypothetical protein
MSYYDRASTSDFQQSKPRSQRAQNWTNKLLSNEQKAKLSITAKAAWEIQSRAGLVEGNFDDWRYAQTKIACGVESLREANQSHFRSILAHFLRLAGKTAEADAVWKKTGRVEGSSQIADTHENREVARAIIRDIVAESKGKISEAYVMTIVASKHPDVAPQDLTARDLQNLVYTLKSRLRNK